MTKLDYYITTTIPYVNGRPHIGHALEFVQADALARRLKLSGKKVILQTGTDDNAIKNVRSAEEAGVGPKEFVDQNAKEFRLLCQDYCIDYDQFVRTSSDTHKKGVQKFWKALNPDDLYRKSYSGLYCYGCEDFYKEEDLVDGLCPDHQKVPEHIEEENVFFRLSRYQEQLVDLIQSNKLRIEPQSRKNEVLAFIKRGLTDISISRSKLRTGGWGVPVPNQEDQVVYVWIDALINYLTGQGYGENEGWQNVWNDDVNKVHCIGKNVWKFHAIYWPALLLSANLPLPNEIYIHGFLTESGQKISKSLGAKVDPLELVKEYGADSVRFYLLQGFSPYADGDFSVEGLIAVHNTFLVNGFGNLFSRLWKLCETSAVALGASRLSIDDPPIGPFKFNEYAQAILKRVDALNSDINNKRPWEEIKIGNKEETWPDLKSWASEFVRIGYLVGSLVPLAGSKIKGFTQTKNNIHLFDRIT